MEIRIYVDCIKIINHPGPEKSIDMDELKAGQAIARRYRNRRIGEFLKEIDLSEKKSTGITKILRALKINGSPLPEFKSDEERNYLIATIRPHDAFATNEVVNEVVNEDAQRQMKILFALKEKPDITIKQLAEKTGIAKATLEREMKKMKQANFIKRIGSDKTGYWEIIEGTE